MVPVVGDRHVAQYDKHDGVKNEQRVGVLERATQP